MNYTSDETKFKWCIGIAVVILLALSVVFITTFDPLGYMFAMILIIVIIFIIGGLKINNR